MRDGGTEIANVTRKGHVDLSKIITKPTMCHLRTLMTQISLGIHQSDQSSLCVHCDDTGLMHGLICVFAGRKPAFKSCPTQLSMKFKLLINTEIAKINANKY